jgi:4a-hydroxytetrahydrobiopterin dehydratase
VGAGGPVPAGRSIGSAPERPLTGGPGRPLRRQEASGAVSGLGWRDVLGVLRANLPAGSLVEAADTAARVVAACGDDAAERLSVDLRLTTVAGVGGGPPRSVQVLEIAIDVLDIA